MFVCINMQIVQSYMLELCRYKHMHVYYSYILKHLFIRTLFRSTPMEEARSSSANLLTGPWRRTSTWRMTSTARYCLHFGRWRHDTFHNDTLPNGTLQKWLGITLMLHRVRPFYCYNERRYTECRGATLEVVPANPQPYFKPYIHTYNHICVYMYI